MSHISEENAVSDITKTISQIEPQLSRLQPRRTQLLRRHELCRDQILNLPVGDMAAHGMTLMDPAREPGTAVDFGLSRLLAIGLYLSKPLLPSTHLEPVVRETDLAPRVALALTPTVELTWNWDETNYEHGTGYGHIALGVTDIYATCDHLTKMGVDVTRPAGPMKFAPTETGEKEVIAFLNDPDGYSIELIEMAK
jgi:catechol 2,3-dioxygenase-like lactoylglutathione lyase family enzyme